MIEISSLQLQKLKRIRMGVNPVFLQVGRDEICILGGEGAPKKTRKSYILEVSKGLVRGSKHDSVIVVNPFHMP